MYEKRWLRQQNWIFFFFFWKATSNFLQCCEAVEIRSLIVQSFYVVEMTDHVDAVDCDESRRLAMSYVR